MVSMNESVLYCIRLLLLASIGSKSICVKACVVGTMHASGKYEMQARYYEHQAFYGSMIKRILVTRSIISP